MADESFVINVYRKLWRSSQRKQKRKRERLRFMDNQSIKKSSQEQAEINLPDDLSLRYDLSCGINRGMAG